MGSIVGFIILAFILIWAFRLEIGIDKANEALKRIEDKVNKTGKNGDKK